MNSYVSQAGWIAEELRESLAIEDQEALHADCAQLGEAGWREWERANRDEANDYLQATPQQRASKKKWADPLLRRRLVLAAYRQGRLAVELIQVAGGADGWSYRRATAWAARVALMLADKADADLDWPFEVDENGKSPAGWKDIPFY